MPCISLTRHKSFFKALRFTTGESKNRLAARNFAFFARRICRVMEEIFDRADVQQKDLKRGNYMSRLMAELRRRRIERATSICVRASAVKTAADVSMAMAARGRTAWSRAILLAREGKMPAVRAKAKTKATRFFNRWKSLKSRSFRTLRRSTSRYNGVSSSPPPSPSSSSPVSSFLNPPSHGVSSRIQTLRTLVPGGRGLDTPLLLKEVADYILALKMQVESMKTLAEVLENSASF